MKLEEPQPGKFIIIIIVIIVIIVITITIIIFILSLFDDNLKKDNAIEILMDGLHFNIFYFSNYIFVLAILPLVVLARGTEAWEPTPEHISVSLRWKSTIFVIVCFTHLTNDLVDV